MKYFKLLYNFNKSTNYIICRNEKKLEYEFEKGIFVNGYNEINFFYNPDEGEIITDYISQINGIPLFSEKFKNLTEELLKSYVQYLPVNIINTKNKQVTKSYILNIIKTVDALDLTYSDYFKIPLDNQEVLSVSKFALNKNLLNESHVFRLKNYLLPIFISEDLKKIIQKNKLIGFDFTEVLLV